MDKGKCRGQNKPLWRDLQDSLALGDRLQPGLAGLWRPPGLRERQVWGRLGKGAHCLDGPVSGLCSLNSLAHPGRGCPRNPGLEDSPGATTRAGSCQRAVVKQGSSWMAPTTPSQLLPKRDTQDFQASPSCPMTRAVIDYLVAIETSPRLAMAFYRANPTPCASHSHFTGGPFSLY